MCVNVYLPNCNNSDDYEEETLNCFAFIDSMFMQHVDGSTKFMLAGDFNFDEARLHGSPRLEIVRNFLLEYNLAVCDHLDISCLGYTYFNESLNVSSLIDHVFISYDCVSEIGSYAVLDSGLNFSDHCVVSFVIKLSNSVPVHNFAVPRDSHVLYVWNDADIVRYRDATNERLSLLCCSNVRDCCSFPCNNCDHRGVINDYAGKLALLLNECALVAVKHKTVLISHTGVAS